MKSLWKKLGKQCHHNGIRKIKYPGINLTKKLKSCLQWKLYQSENEDLRGHYKIERCLLCLDMHNQYSYSDYTPKIYVWISCNFNHNTNSFHYQKRPKIAKSPLGNKVKAGGITNQIEVILQSCCEKWSDIGIKTDVWINDLWWGSQNLTLQEKILCNK